MWAPTRVCAYEVGAHRGQRDRIPPGGGVTGGCELPAMVAGSLTLSPGRAVH